MAGINIYNTKNTLQNTATTAIIAAQTAAKLPKLRAKLSNIRAGLTTGTNGINGQAKIGIIGDSTTMGAGAGTSGTTNTTAARPKCISRIMPTQFTQFGIAAIADTFMGDQGYYNIGGSTTGYPLYDSRLAFTGTTSIYPDGTYRSAGGIYFRLNAALDTLTFTPENSWDTAVIFYENGSAGTATMTLGNAGVITGGSVVTTANTGKQSFGTQTITIVKAATSLIFTQTTGTPVIRGVWCYDSTTPRVNFFNLGNYGSQLTIESPLIQPCLASDLYDCIIINQSINDANINGAAGINNYVTQLTALITAAQSAGTDVILTTANANTVTSMPSYVSAIQSVATSLGLPLIDINTRQVSYTVANATGLMFDSSHPNASGYQDVAVQYGNVIVRP